MLGRIVYSVYKLTFEMRRVVQKIGVMYWVHYGDITALYMHNMDGRLVGRYTADCHRKQKYHPNGRIKRSCICKYHNFTILYLNAIQIILQQILIKPFTHCIISIHKNMLLPRATFFCLHINVSP